MKNNLLIGVTACLIGILIGVWGINHDGATSHAMSTQSDTSLLYSDDKESYNSLVNEINQLRHTVVALKTSIEANQAGPVYSDEPAPYSVTSNEAITAASSQQLTADAEAQYISIRENSLADLSANSATLPEVMSTTEVTAMPVELQKKLLGEILARANRGELDYRELFPEN